MKSAEMLSLELSLKKRRNTVLEKIESLKKSRESLSLQKEAENKQCKESIHLIDRLAQLLKISYDYHHDKPVYTPPVTDDESEPDDSSEVLKERISKIRYANFCFDLQNLLEKINKNTVLKSKYIFRNTAKVTNAVTYHEDYPYLCEDTHEQDLFYKGIYYQSKLALLNNYYELKVLKAKSIGYNKELKHLSLHIEALATALKPAPLLFMATPKIEYRKLLSPLKGVSHGIDDEKAKLTK